MFSELMARAEAHFEKGLPLVLYRKPKEHIINGLFQADSALRHVGDFTEEGFVFAPFRSEEPCVLMLRDAWVRASDFVPKKDLVDNPFPVVNDLHAKDFHIELIKKGITHVRQNDFEKVVLSRYVTVDTNKSPFELFTELLSRYPNAFCYLWFHPKVGLWLGATPEILVQTQNNVMTTMSLAGTRIYEEPNDRPWGHKEQSEQALVTQYIKTALKGKVSNLTSSEVLSVRAGNLEHLRTKIEGRFDGPLSAIVQVLHPTPAVCGMPLDPARNFILEHEGYHRGFYTGFLGELNFKSVLRRSTDRKNQENQAYKTVKTRTTLWVNLRCMQMVDNKCIVYVGGGITKDSVPEKEWMETVEKSKTMLKLF